MTGLNCCRESNRSFCSNNDSCNLSSTASKFRQGRRKAHLRCHVPVIGTRPFLLLLLFPLINLVAPTHGAKLWKLPLTNPLQWLRPGGDTRHLQATVRALESELSRLRTLHTAHLDELRRLRAKRAEDFARFREAGKQQAAENERVREAAVQALARAQEKEDRIEEELERERKRWRTEAETAIGQAVREAVEEERRKGKEVVGRLESALAAARAAGANEEEEREKEDEGLRALQEAFEKERRQFKKRLGAERELVEVTLAREEKLQQVILKLEASNHALKAEVGQLTEGKEGKEVKVPIESRDQVLTDRPAATVSETRAPSATSPPVPAPPQSPVTAGRIKTSNTKMVEECGSASAPPASVSSTVADPSLPSPNTSSSHSSSKSKSNPSGARKLKNVGKPKASVRKAKTKPGLGAGKMETAPAKKKKATTSRPSSSSASSLPASSGSGRASAARPGRQPVTPTLKKGGLGAPHK